MKAYNLSKSKIISGLQCEKRLYLEIHQPELAEVGAADEHRFDMGHRVNEVAQSFFPGGRMIEYDEGLTKAVQATAEHLSDTPDIPLFEATFSHDGVLIRSDILLKEDSGYRMIEVKSATSVKDYYLNDCAVQAYVMEGAGFPLSRIELAHIDNSFIYQGDYKYNGLLYHADLTKESKAIQSQVPKWVSNFKTMLAGAEPQIKPGDQCHDPFTCPFVDHCIKETSDYPVSILPRGGRIAEELINEGIEDVRDIPEGRLSNLTHEKVRRVTIAGKPEVDPEIRRYLNSLPYPRYYIDFETIQFPVPIWRGTRPYQQLPFQWSCHIEDAHNNLTHEEFLDISGESPLAAFTDSLINVLRDSGPIFVYSHFEKSRLSELAAFFPERLEEIERIKDRLVDLLPLVRNYYYHPDMKGSFSIKAVLPTVAPDLDYGVLDEVQDGTGAQTAFLEAIHPEITIKRRQNLEQKMLKYCEMDSMAMVKLVIFLNHF